MSDIVARLREGKTDGSHLRWTITPIHIEAAGEIERLRKALERQGDNMAFVINHVTIPDQWYEKFRRELDEDRAALDAIKEG